MRAFRLTGLALLLVACGEGGLPRPVAVATSVAELRPTDTSSALMWKYAPGEVVESSGVDGGGFLVHFTRAGANAVPALDADDSGVPDFVERVDAIYEEVGALYHGPLGFRRPLSDANISPNGGDGRFDVYLLDFARAADGAFRVDRCLPGEPDRCIGYVVQENDFAGYGYPNTTVATRILASHEYFHAVQAAYDANQNVVVSEGTAVWATERFDPSTNDFENFIHGYLERPDRSLDSAPPGPVPTFAYGSAIFFLFLTERFDDAIIRRLWERLENGQGDPLEPADVANPTFLVQLDALLKREYASSFSEAFVEFATWNLYLAGAADPTKAYAEGARYPAVAITPVTAPHRQEGGRFFYAATQYFEAQAAGRTQMTAALVDSPLTSGDDLEGMVLVLAARRAGRIIEVRRVSAMETVDVTGGSGVLAVINANRGALGAALSQRPAVCFGSPDEVAACVAALGGGATPDAGLADAGVGPPDGGLAPDAGVDAGTEPPSPPEGCGCGIVDPSAMFALLAGALAGRRRR
jgi:hypothetical protein